jgi:hypothetical protein
VVVHATGRGFEPGLPVAIEWKSESGWATELAQGNASDNGVIDLRFTVPPDQSPGRYTIRAQASNGMRWTATFTIVELT